MKTLLPLILVILVLTGAITYVLSKNTLPKIITKQEVVSPNELEVDSFTTPTPTSTPTPKATPTPKVVATKGGSDSSIVSIVPTITIKKPESTEPKGGVNEADIKVIDSAKRTITTKTTICTPVYGMADTCTEHIVVDTAGEDSAFLNFAGLSYLAGLVAFIKAKYA
jgi:hypothetical protein